MEGAGISKSLFIIAATIPSRKKSRVGLVKFAASIAKLLLLIVWLIVMDCSNHSELDELSRPYKRLEIPHVCFLE